MLIRDEQDGVLVLRLAHGRANALDLELVEALRAQLERVRGVPCDSREGLPAEGRGNMSRRTSEFPRAVVLTGAGSIFSAGVDLKRFVKDGPEYAARLFDSLSVLLHTLFTLDLPVIAAINGHAIAGGCLLAFACDHRIMATGNGRIGLPELLVGLPFPAIAHEIVRFAVPAQHLRQLVYSGATLHPEEAIQKGFLEEIAPAGELEPRALRSAAQYADVPREIFRHTKRFLLTESLDRLSRRQAEADAEALAVWRAAETHAQVRAYVERTLG